jgi:phage terminase large subunit
MKPRGKPQGGRSKAFQAQLAAFKAGLAPNVLPPAPGPKAAVERKSAPKRAIPYRQKPVPRPARPRSPPPQPASGPTGPTVQGAPHAPTEPQAPPARATEPPKPRQTISIPFAPRAWQIPLIDDPAKRIVAVVHRRAGKSTALMWRGLKRCLTEVKWPNPRVVHILPFGVQWQRTGLWDDLVRAADAIPGASVRRSEMSVKLPNGGTYQCGGADNQDVWRGGGAIECIIDEFDDTPPSMVPLVIEPMLADRNGTLVRSGTPKGNGLLEAAYNRATTTPGYSAYLLDYTKTEALTPEAIERLRTEMTEEEFAQELECSFASPNSGSYYGRAMDALLRDGRITSVPHDPSLKVWTAWDLGVHDSTAIWFAQVTKSGEWRIIDYIEDSGAGLDHYAGLLQSRPYIYEKHLLPHDAKVKELGSGKSRTETMHGLGIRPTRVIKAHSVADGINAVRMILPKAWFDATKCARGIHALRHYKREWNEQAQAWRASPVHDHASHGSDAMRYLCLGVREEGASVGSNIIRSQFGAPRVMQTGHGADTGWMSV